METPKEASRQAMVRRIGLIITGMVMYLFIVCHLLNLSLGLHSVASMDDWRPWLTGLWGGPMGLVLLLCMIVHFALSLWSIYLRNTLRVPTYDAVQMIAGLLIIPLLAAHVTGLIAARELGVQPSYVYILQYFWIDAPEHGLRQVLLLAAAWLHGSIGVFTWLRARSTTRRWLVVYYPFVVLLPILALLGYVDAGRQIVPVELGGSGTAIVLLAEAVSRFPPIDPAEFAAVVGTAQTWNQWLAWGSLSLAALVFFARWLRVSQLPKEEIVRVIFADRNPVEMTAAPGLTLLEMTQEHHVPHAGICRGRGRCGTCRVHVLRSEGAMPPPDALEQKTLERLGVPPGTRLACQLYPAPGRLEVERVVAPDYSDLDAAQGLGGPIAEPAE